MKSARPDFSATRKPKPVVNALMCFDPVDVDRDPEEGLLVPLFIRIKGEDIWYELPGGKPDKGETFAQAIVRECEEEMGIKVEVVESRKIHHMPHPFLPDSKKIYIVCRHVSGDPVNMLPDEHEELVFVSPAEAVRLLGERISQPVRESLLNIGKLQNHRQLKAGIFDYTS